jgi:hypothetical protein
MRKWAVVIALVGALAMFGASTKKVIVYRPVTPAQVAAARAYARELAAYRRELKRDCLLRSEGVTHV